MILLITIKNKYVMLHLCVNVINKVVIRKVFIAIVVSLLL